MSFYSTWLLFLLLQWHISVWKKKQYFVSEIHTLNTLSGSDPMFWFCLVNKKVQILIQFPFNEAWKRHKRKEEKDNTNTRRTEKKKQPLAILIINRVTNKWHSYTLYSIFNAQNNKAIIIIVWNNSDLPE